MTSHAPFAATPPPPYYAVIFTTVRSGADAAGYAVAAAQMMALAAEQPGYLGAESAHEDLGITVSYWRSLQDIAAWKNNAEHRAAQARGRSEWYAAFRLRVCKVERDSAFTASG